MAAETPGNLFVVAAPSGAGKTTLVKALVDSVPNITVSVSHTTRPKRPNETHAIHYYFIEKTEFEKMIEHHDFLEYAMVFDHYYGTSKRWVEKIMSDGMDVILEIDWQGHQQIKRLFPSAISIFILPPSIKDLQNRLVKRNEDDALTIQKRLADAKETVSHLSEFDYILINDDFNRACADLRLIVEVSRLSGHRQIVKYARLINEIKSA